MSVTLPRLPGLTPRQQEALRARLDTCLQADGDPVEGVIQLLADAIQEAVPREVNANHVLVSRLLAFSDELRNDGKPGMARDLDRMAGILFELSRRQHEAALLLDAYRFAAGSEPEAALPRLNWAAAQDRGKALAQGVQRRLEDSFAAGTRTPVPVG